MMADIREIILYLYQQHPMSTIQLYRTLLELGHKFTFEEVKATVAKLKEEGVLVATSERTRT